ncbi:MAG TPA: hypothetical protein VMW73_12025 [Spirochaetia bacterium]|nr:hypothetical protein [Spirochaetia bacterium]
MTAKSMKFQLLLVSMGLAFLLLSVPLFAQPNSVIDSVLSQKQASFEDSVYLILTAGNLLPSSGSVQDALDILKQKGWLTIPAKPDAPITFGQYAFLLMRTFNIPGGVLYSLFPGPRYAGREVDYKGWTPSNLSPYEGLSGRDALYILRSYLDSRGGA